MNRRRKFACAAVVAGTALGALSSGASAKPPRRNAFVRSVETPLGLQGVASAGPNIVIPFTLVDATRQPVEVELQYGIDHNGDGLLTDGTETPPIGSPPYPDEYRQATEDRLDPRDTRKNKTPQLFATGVAGAAHGIVWKSTADLFTERLMRVEYQLTPQGRPVPDPDNPGAFLYATGPTGSPANSGVRVRLRTVFRQRARPRLVASPWVYSGSFEVNNSNAPSMTIDAVEAPPSSPVSVRWSIFDRDSEDFNGNGVLDVAQGEDIDGDGVLYGERVGVAFDYHRIPDGEDPATMTDEQLAAVPWWPCTRLVGAGDTDSLDAKPGMPIPTSGDLAGLPSAPPFVGRHWVFVWDMGHDVGRSIDRFILRATPFDQHRSRGPTVYWRTIFRTDN